MKRLGFFDPILWDSRKVPLPVISDCNACGLYRRCNSPKIGVHGQGKKRILLIDEYPSKSDDLRNKPMSGLSGQVISDTLHSFGIDMDADCWRTSGIICAPKDKDRFREPTSEEVKYCRPNLSKTLFDLKPDVVIPFGKIACQALIPIAWKEGEVEDIKTWVGWQIPSTKLNAWLCPTFHPACFEMDKSGTMQMFFKKHLRAAVKLSGKPWETIPNWKDYIEIYMAADQAAARIRELASQGVPLAFDYETTTLKPDGPHSEIICCSISDGKVSIAYPWVGEAIQATKEFIVSDVPKIAANMKFEERWTRKKLRVPVKNWLFDTMLASHWLDCRHGITSLKFQSFVLFGVEDYDSHLAPYRESQKKGGNEPNRLKLIDPRTLLEYCALDSLFEVMVAEAQMQSPNGNGWKDEFRKYTP